MKWVVVGVIVLDRRDHAVPEAGPERFHQSVRFILWCDPDHHSGLFVRDGFVAADRRGRFVVEPDLGNDGRDAADHVSRISRSRLDGCRSVFCDRAVDRRHRLYRRLERRHDLAGPEDRFLGRLDAAKSADRDPRRCSGIGSGAGLSADLLNNNETYYQKIDASSPVAIADDHGRQAFPAERRVPRRNR